jgi:TnpA family transposase
VPTGELLTQAQHLRFAEIPANLDDRLMARQHTLSKKELATIRKRRGPENRLGFAVQLALLKFIGRPLRPARQVPEKIGCYVAAQMQGYLGQMK